MIAYHPDVPMSKRQVLLSMSRPRNSDDSCSCDISNSVYIRGTNIAHYPPFNIAFREGERVSISLLSSPKLAVYRFSSLAYFLLPELNSDVPKSSICSEEICHARTKLKLLGRTPSFATGELPPKQHTTPKFAGSHALVKCACIRRKRYITHAAAVIITC